MLLYIHPYGHVIDDFVPTGAVNLINRVSVDKIGRHAHEVTDDDIAAARVAALDLHWCFSIEPARWVAENLKRRATRPCRHAVPRLSVSPSRPRIVSPAIDRRRS